MPVDFYSRLTMSSDEIKAYFKQNPGDKTLDTIYAETMNLSEVSKFLAIYPETANYAIKELVQHQIRNYINSKSRL